MKIAAKVVTLFFAFLTTNTFATHIIGGDITYKCLGNNQYEIKLTLYRDCSPSSAPFDGTASWNKGDIGIFDQNNNLLDSIELTSPPVITKITQTLNKSCFSLISASICVEQGVYTFIKTLPPIPGGYNITYTRCCRNAGTLNLINPSTTGTAILTQLSDTTIIKCNSTPYFKGYPPIALCMNDSFSISSAATDDDGDSLVYSLCAPLNYQNSNINMVSFPPSAPPYVIVNWAPGFTPDTPLGPYGSLTIDASTGILSGITNAIGQFVVCVCVTEYRNGKQIGYYRRDFQFNSVACQPAKPAFTSKNTCHGVNTGSVSASIPDGGTYTYSWMPGNYTGTSITGLGSGQYTLTATEASNCKVVDSITIGKTPFLSTPKTYPICANDSIQLVSLPASSNHQWYNTSNVAISAPTGTNDSLFLPTPLPGETYIDSIADATGCLSRYTHTFIQAHLLLNTSSTYLSAANANDGSATATVSGGSVLMPGYEYLWLPGNETTNHISGLSAGVYTVTVTSGGCSSSATVTISTNPVNYINSSNSKENPVLLYPNPLPKATDHLITVKNLKSEMTIHLAVKDILGKECFSTILQLDPVVYTKKIEGVSNLNAGVYFVEINFNNTFVSEKLIIQ